MTLLQEERRREATAGEIGRSSFVFQAWTAPKAIRMVACGEELFPISWSGYFMTGLADAGKTGVPQVSPDAIGTVSPISQSAGCRNSAAFAGWETRDTADLEVCGTRLPLKYPLSSYPNAFTN